MSCEIPAHRPVEDGGGLQPMSRFSLPTKRLNSGSVDVEEEQSLVVLHLTMNLRLEQLRLISVLATPHQSVNADGRELKVIGSGSKNVQGDDVEDLSVSPKSQPLSLKKIGAPKP